MEDLSKAEAAHIEVLRQLTEEEREFIFQLAESTLGKELRQSELADSMHPHESGQVTAKETVDKSPEELPEKEDSSYMS